MQEQRNIVKWENKIKNNKCNITHPFFPPVVFYARVIRSSFLEVFILHLLLISNTLQSVIMDPYTKNMLNHSS